MAEIHDGLIIGAGHNGLVLGCYLAKAGLRILAFDRRETVGGGLSVLENPRHPGFFHNTHAFFLRALDRMPWYRDLELARHGLEMNEPELNVVLVTRDHETLEWWTDFERTRRSFARFSDRDAGTLARWHEDFLTITERILIPEACSPPLPPDRRRALLEKSPEGRRLLAVSQLSPLEFVTREIESPVIRAGLLFFNGLREVDLRVPGFGHHIAFLLANPAKAQIVMGGSGKLAMALEAAFREAGGEIMTGVEPERIIVENGRASGVKLADGERIRARHFVASSLNPQQTFLELLANEDLPASWRARRNWRAFRKRTSFTWHARSSATSLAPGVSQSSLAFAIGRAACRNTASAIGNESPLSRTRHDALSLPEIISPVPPWRQVSPKPEIQLWPHADSFPPLATIRKLVQSKPGEIYRFTLPTRTSGHEMWRLSVCNLQFV